MNTTGSLTKQLIVKWELAWNKLSTPHLSISYDPFQISFPRQDTSLSTFMDDQKESALLLMAINVQPSSGKTVEEEPVPV